MTCLNCMSNPGWGAHVAIEDGGTERNITMQLCAECYRDFGDTVGVTVSRTQPTDEHKDT